MKANILLVDDQPANLLALEATLSGLGQNLVRAGSGPEALRRLLHDDFAAVLLDVRMPGMDGYETASLIRQRQRSERTPILFLTAHDEEARGSLQGYSLGAVDYLTKPFVPQVLRSKVSVFVDLFLKTEEVRRQADLLREAERREHERELATARQRLEAEHLRQELRIAQEVQERLFPAAAPQLAGYDVAGASQPAAATGGDYYDYICLSDGGLGVAIGDVSGHGLGPALVMAEMRAYLRAFLLAGHEVGPAVTLLNRALSADAAEGRFATLLVGRLDSHAHSLVYTSAGHGPGLLVGADGVVKAQLRSTGVPLAVLPDSAYVVGPAIRLDHGDVLILTTDGVPEAQGANGQHFGVERGLQAVRARMGGGARDVVTALFDAVREFSGNRTQDDDITIVAIKRSE